MYRHVLAGILADHFVDRCGWSEDRAIELGQKVLRDNVDEVFPSPSNTTGLTQVDRQVETWVEEDDKESAISDSSIPEPDATDSQSPPSAAAATTSALAAGAIGMVEVGDAGAKHPDAVDNTSGMTKFDEPGDTETVRIDEDERDEIVLNDSEFAGEGSAEAEDDLADLPTTFESSDTVRFESQEVDAEAVSDFAESDEPLDDPGENSDHPLDPLPSHDEIQAVDVDDVTLHDGPTGNVAVDHEQVESEADPEPLNIGDIWGEDDGADDSDESELLATIDLEADDDDVEVSFELLDEEEEQDGTS